MYLDLSSYELSGLILCWCMISGQISELWSGRAAPVYMVYVVLMKGQWKLLGELLLKGLLVICD